jgi:hypothetical protein
MDAELGKPNAEPHGRDVEPLTKSLLEMLLQSRESGSNLLNVRSADNQSKLVSANPPAVSVGPFTLAGTSLKSLMTASPARWPYPSLIALK